MIVVVGAGGLALVVELEVVVVAARVVVVIGGAPVDRRSLLNGERRLLMGTKY